MTEGVPSDRLSAKRQFVLVLRLVVESDGKMAGELVDPLTEQGQRFTGLHCLVDGLRAWVEEALRTIRESASQTNQKRPGT